MDYMSAILRIHHYLGSWEQFTERGVDAWRLDSDRAAYERKRKEFMYPHDSFQPE